MLRLDLSVPKVWLLPCLNPFFELTSSDSDFCKNSSAVAVYREKNKSRTVHPLESYRRTSIRIDQLYRVSQCLPLDDTQRGPENFTIVWYPS